MTAAARLRSIALPTLLALVVATLVGVVLFLSTTRSTVVAGHEAGLRPTLDGRVTLRNGPFLPDLRMPTGGRIGADITLGKTEGGSPDQVVQRYALIASHPEGQISRIRNEVLAAAVSAALRGAGVGVLAALGWVLVGARRRRELARAALSRRAIGVVAVLGLVAVAIWQPWRNRSGWTGEPTWQPLDQVVAGVPLPPEADGIQVSAEGTSGLTTRLVRSAIDVYQTSKTFYADAAERAADLDVRPAGEGETVAVLVTDRHDNIGMDAVARAIGDAAGATVVLDGGDDTSTGATWEAFSLDSLDAAFAGYDRFAVAGNHDHGGFVSGYLAERGWTHLDGEVVEGPGGSTLLGVDDPRSSGLGNWRDESGLSFSEQASRIADDACAAEERIATLLVHDANSGAEALERGCVDLVLAGHVHVVEGPTPVVGENGETGWSFTNGTTGGRRTRSPSAASSSARRPSP